MKKNYVLIFYILSLSRMIHAGQLEQLFLRASYKGNLEEVRHHLEEVQLRGPTETRLLVNFQDEINPERNTALHYASMQGHSEIAQLLLNNGADPKTPSAHGWTALHYAALNGYTEIVEFLIHSGAEINPADHRYYTPLHYACKNGHLGTIERLLDELNVNNTFINRLTIHAKNEHGLTPGELAREQGFKRVLTLLDQHRTTQPQSVLVPGLGLFPQPILEIVNPKSVNSDLSCESIDLNLALEGPENIDRSQVGNEEREPNQPLEAKTTGTTGWNIFGACLKRADWRSPVLNKKPKLSD